MTLIELVCKIQGNENLSTQLLKALIKNKIASNSGDDCLSTDNLLAVE